VYFNATLQTWLMWVMTLGCVIALYEAIKYLMRLFFTQQAGITTFWTP
jgi:hypothetical protein